MRNLLVRVNTVDYVSSIGTLYNHDVIAAAAEVRNSSKSGIYQAVANCVERELGGRVQAELEHDAIPVSLNSADANGKLAGNLLVGFSGGQSNGYFLFSA